MYNKHYTSFNIFIREHVLTGQELSLWNKSLIYGWFFDGRYMTEYFEPPLGVELKPL